MVGICITARDRPFVVAYRRSKPETMKPKAQIPQSLRSLRCANKSQKPTRASRSCSAALDFPELVSKVSLTLFAAILIAFLLLPNLVSAQERKINVRFEAVDIFVDSGAKPLAAYQLEFRVEKGDAKIVGVE